MYGTWSIRATVINTDAPPGYYTLRSDEVWTLEKENKDVTLRNVVTAAVTSVNVDNVEGNTATFHHEASARAERMKVMEVPTITVSGDTITGINRQLVTLYNGNGSVSQVFHLDIHIDGTRLAGAKVLFHDPDDTPKSFEVAPLEYK